MKVWVLIIDKADGKEITAATTEAAAYRLVEDHARANWADLSQPPIEELDDADDFVELYFNESGESYTLEETALIGWEADESAKKPTAAQLAALVAFAGKRRTWKAELRQCWMSGNYPAGCDSASLQQLRNAFGPSWLVTFRLKREVSQ